MIESLGSFFLRLKELSATRPISIEFLLLTLGVQATPLIIMILSLPFGLPIPLPGLSTLFGSVMAAGAVAIFFRVPPYMPNSWKVYVLSPVLISKLCDYGIKIGAKIDRWVHPRGKSIIKILFLEKWAAICILMAALFLALPLPPGTNFPPALSIFLLCLAIIFDDLVFYILGFLSFIANAIIFYTITDWLVQFLMELLN